MHALILALIGLPAGLALDRIVGRFAVPFVDDEEEEPPAPSVSESARRQAGAEAGSLVIHADEPASGWLRRLLIVVVTVALFAAAGARYSDPLHLAIVSAYLCALIVCAATDVLVYRVPNVITYPAILGALLLAAVMPDASIASALAGAGLAGGCLLVPALFTGGLGMGMGDVKLAVFAGLALGFVFVIPALLVMALSGGLIASLLMIFRLRHRGEPIPYAPFIAGGAAAAMLLQGTVFVTLN
jgi:prepilin signal peptidase PulO-like enzyme (type II secretory pathway)